MAKKVRKKVGTQLRSKRQANKIDSPMRELVLARVTELGLSRYDLAKRVEKHMSAQAVYDYLAARRDMTSGYLWHLLAALDLEVAPAKSSHGIPAAVGIVGSGRKRPQTPRKLL